VIPRKVKGLFVSSLPGSKYSRLAATTIAAQSGASRIFAGTSREWQNLSRGVQSPSPKLEAPHPPFPEVPGR
jgi:hypothetical protein